MSRKSLLITGPQGSGKSTTARAIAETFGPNVLVVSERELLSKLMPAGLNNCDVCIVEECTRIDHFKPFVSQPRMQYDRMYMDMITIDTPPFIFVANEGVNVQGPERRFNVLELHSMRGRVFKLGRELEESDARIVFLESLLRSVYELHTCRQSTSDFIDLGGPEHAEYLYDKAIPEALGYPEVKHD